MPKSFSGTAWKTHEKWGRAIIRKSVNAKGLILKDPRKVFGTNIVYSPKRRDRANQMENDPDSNPDAFPSSKDDAASSRFQVVLAGSKGSGFRVRVAAISTAVFPAR